MLRHLVAVAWVVLGLAGARGEEWHHPLSLNGGDYWRGRIPVVVRNLRDVAAEGEHVALRIGTGSGQAALVGQEARGIRLVDAAGSEMLFALTDCNGMPWTEGPMPEGGTLAIPVECPPRAETRY